MRGVRSGGARGRGLVLAALVWAGIVAAADPERAAVAPPVAEMRLGAGEGLRLARTALEAGDLPLAETLAARVAVQHPIVADYADWLRMRALVEAERFEDADALLDERTHVGSTARVELLELLGEARRRLGRESAARIAWEQATRLTRDRARLASLHTRIAESYQRQGDLSRAAEIYRHVWVNYPEQGLGQAADRVLAELERELGRRYRDADHTLERAGILYRRNRNEGALAAYDQAIVLGLPAASRRKAEAGRAATLFRLRRYPEAAQAYGSLRPTEERRIQQARAYARSGQVARGARDLEELGSGSRTSQGIRALLIAALLWDGEGAWERAHGLYRRVIDRAPGSGAAATSRWRIGWEAYRSGRYGEAITQFDRLARAERDPIAALRPRYWSLRAREARGEAGAAAGYAELAASHPLTYYGWRAAARAPIGFDAGRVPRAVAAGTTALAPKDLARVRILVEAGLVEPARVEIAGLDRRARGLADRLSLAQLHADLGDFNRAQRLVVDGYGEGLSRGPVPEQLELWWHAWPAPFESELAEVRDAGVRLDTALLYSIMREESGYRPEVISVSGARGLLQLMPTTAERVAQQQRLASFHADDLFLPAVNIRLGSAYLEGLLREFDGRKSAAIGSYNAGPHAVSRWVAKNTGEDDEFVEEIPYDQTRAYVKRVMRSLHAYRVLY
ncbi:MAG: transglycosylase SLT domain-containing protein [Myxococcota bacterium]